MSKGGGQYGEDAVLLRFFREQSSGFLVDVGAADGRDNSNSYMLLLHPNWKGVLIEPEPVQMAELAQFYQGRSGITLVQQAVAREEKDVQLFCCRQVSTLKTEWRDRCIQVHKVDYKEVRVHARPLFSILDEAQVPKEFDFLSIDCEGMDREVLDTLWEGGYKPRLFCIEAKGMPPPAGYREYAQTSGNVFYERIPHV